MSQTVFHRVADSEELILRAKQRDPEALSKLLFARGQLQKTLFASAQQVRDRFFGRTVVVRGVIEVTSACIKECEYCPMRASNSQKRYYRRPDEIIAAVRQIRDAGIGVVFLQGGEVPHTTRTVAEIIPDIREIFVGEVEVLLCLGDKPKTELLELKQAGADSYIIKHETSDPSLHAALRHVSLESRLECARDLIELGYRTGIGTIVGLPGQTARSLVQDVLLPAELGARMTSASPFIPAQSTPMAKEAPGDVDLTLNVIALMRLANPSALIPTVSALEKLRPRGQQLGLHAGANVITVNFTPTLDQERYPIYGSDRFIVKSKHALTTIANAGLQPRLGRAAFDFWDNA